MAEPLPAELLPAVMPLTAARTQIASAARRAQHRDEPTVLTDHGSPLAVVVGFDEWRELTALRRESLLTELRRRQRSSTWIDHDQVVASLES
ncbi:MAG TPA: type II toxin-antitoxin system Phd/YefM family antitoxin [Micromonosporaceae bacterium]|nr:type II toxin-antitoxin system Phd/YefM family antitoxin [Micromonosporaceae bacterium]